MLRYCLILFLSANFKEEVDIIVFLRKHCIKAQCFELVVPLQDLGTPRLDPQQKFSGCTEISKFLLLLISKLSDKFRTYF